MEDYKINVLDHGFVRLFESMGSDLSIVRNARVSHDAAWRAGEDEKSDYKLINYLMKHNHSTPFESVTLTFEVKAPIFVLRQWHRHRTWSYNEVSARYTELPSEFYIPSVDLIGIQDKKNHQSRVLNAVLTDNEKKLIKGTINQYEHAAKEAAKTYSYLLNAGWPRELARCVLPVSTYSHMFATVNLHNLFKFCKLRLDPHAQYEIRVYAKAMLDLAKEVCPVAVDAFILHQMKSDA